MNSFSVQNIARYCLDHGAQVDSVNKDGNTPLFCATERLANACAKVNRQEEDVVLV